MKNIMMRESFSKEIQPIPNTLLDSPFNNLAVTFSKNGEALSIFSDDIWDYSATSNLLRTINFRSKIQKLLKTNSIDNKKIDLAVKFLKIFALNWICEVNGCSMTKLNSDLVALSFLIGYCVKNSIEQNHIFTEPDSIDFIITSNTSERQIGLCLARINRFIDTASVLNQNKFWINLQPSEEFLIKLRKARMSFPETTEVFQTMVIPSRIYQALLKDTIEILRIFNEFLDELKYIFSMRTGIRDKTLKIEENAPMAILTSSQKSLFKTYWDANLKKDDKLISILKELRKAGLIKELTWGSLTICLAQIQTRCAIIIAAFTGMRKQEVLAVPFNGLKYINSENGNIPVIWSTTTKLEKSGVPRFTKWVTGSVVEDAFKAAQFIAEGILAWSGNKSCIETDKSKLPLFLSIERGKFSKPHPNFNYTTSSLRDTQLERIMRSKQLLISEKDISEISWFLYGDEISDSVQLGQPWPLGFHQFRRSLAVYAASSGYVSYPTLKSQLKHISMIMTVYYTDSNSRAINILGNGPEVITMQKEWQEAQARVESDNLHELLDSGVKLTGAAGKNLQTKRAENKLPKFLDDRNSTKKAVKNGKIRYRSTLVGGCMSIKPCDKGAGILASACISCENAVFLPESRSSLLQTKDFYESQLTLDIPKRVHHEYETSIKKIDSLLSVLVLN